MTTLARCLADPTEHRGAAAWLTSALPFVNDFSPNYIGLLSFSGYIMSGPVCRHA